MTNEKAIERLELLRQKVDEETYRALIMAIKALERERQGHWIKKGNTLKCPFCGAKGENIKDDYCFNYCPNCGAKMSE